MAAYGIDLAIDEGDFVVLLGPSGRGKTTTLRMIAGLEALTDGELSFDDRLVNGDPPDRRNVGMGSGHGRRAGTTTGSRCGSESGHCAYRARSSP
jgi:ABC-type multidrug transport system ATPase subunit